MPLKPYNQEIELAAVNRRYDTIPKAIRYTLIRLRESNEFCQVVTLLKEERGWKDWHILLAVFNAVFNWHLHLRGADQDAKQMQVVGQQLQSHLIDEGEQEEDPPVPERYFTIEQMENWLHFSIIHYLTLQGAEFKQRGYSQDSIRRIVAQKYHYFELDTRHEPIFD